VREVVKEIMDKSKPIRESDFLKSIFGHFCQDVLSGDMPVVLFGAGSAGQELYPNMKLHGIHPKCFCDNNPSRVGSVLFGIPVISFEELSQKHKDSIVVITTKTYSTEISEQLLNNGFSPEKVLQIDNNRIHYYERFLHHHLSLNDLQDNAELLSETYNMLSDQKSKDLFISRIALFASGADYYDLQQFINTFSDVVTGDDSTNTRYENVLYFNNDVLKIQDDEVLIDGGAFVGESTDEFINTCKNNHVTYQHVYCFEPDHGAYGRLLKNTSQYENVTCFNLGLWSHSTTLRFASSAEMHPGDTRIIRDTGDTDIIAPRDGDTTVNTTSIDDLFHDKRITFIKMDVEGSESEAIQGAANTIIRNKPKLIISAYHMKDDLYKLPVLIHHICPEYKLYLRHFSNYYDETVIIATL
jgi:FkbM family methyltransferase